MKINPRKIALIVAVTALSGCAGGHQKHENVSSEIHSISKLQGEMISRRDAAGIAGLYTSDAEVNPPNAGVVKGTQEIQKYWQSSFLGESVTASIISREVESCGDLAWEVGDYTVAAADGKTLDKGKYVTVYKFKNGSWKLHRDIFNSDLPAAAQ